MSINSQFYHEKSCTYINEIASEAKIYEHPKSGAKVLFLKNDDDNKAFCIGFRTAPSSDNGVAHIMEHSVLCGSRKYPVKEPFVELMKGSLNTFLNAMTYPDKTVYPIASCNEEDFHNLMDVYLDSVFFPKLDKGAFLQEGWHYECDESGKPYYKGVVYNEMKGVYSSPESILFQDLDTHLCPDTAYRFDSGGKPSAIPSLSYEEYCDFHKEKYHPSNSWTVIYGDVDEERCLTQLHNDYFNHYEKKAASKEDQLYQEFFSEERKGKLTYASGSLKEGAEQTFLAMAYLLCPSGELDELMGLQVLEHVLTGTSASPLRKALNSSGLGGDVIGYGISDQSLQLTWTVGIRDSLESRRDDFIKVVDDVFANLATNGIQQDLIDAAINSIEFRLREANYGSTPKGVVYALNAISSWNYGDDPLERFYYEKQLKQLRESLAKGPYLEDLIKKYFIENSHRVTLVCEPEEGLGEKEAAEEQERLNKSWSDFSEAEKKAVNEEASTLLKAQAEADSVEDLATIPQLSRKDLRREINTIPFSVEKTSGVEYLRSAQNSGGIQYVKWAFDLNDFSVEELPMAKLFALSCLSCGTAKKSFEELTTELATCAGGVGAYFSLPSTLESEHKRSMFISAKVMQARENEFLALLKEIVEDLDFSDSVRLKELLTQQISKVQSSFIRGGEWISRLILNSGINEADYLDEKVSGPSFLKFLQACLKRVESGELGKELLALKARVFNRNNLLVSLTGEEDTLDTGIENLKAFTEVLSDTPKKLVTPKITLTKTNVGLATEGQVQYVSVGVNLKEYGVEDDPRFVLLSQLLSTGYLWEKVRVQGGAYGCFLSYEKFDGVLNVCSYRDPNLEETLDVYKGIADFIRELDLSEEEFDKIFIGTFGRIDSPMTVSQKAGVLLSRYIAGIDDEFLQSRRDILLDCTLEDIKTLAPWFDKLNVEGQVCVHGGHSRVEKASELFDKIDYLAGAGGDEDDEDDDEDFYTSH
ncbi:insulinase family protein [Lentisphaera profundi]|uniref:Insulinase family protein n=1 Tax=Lentisphaera profundi TaxID=1658616 RepID=A0ABY7VZ35_9BACT|nr:insulinase family protein [Lentisphaera profundi]WDE97974.1 insulinase family protein [Lentisphaera profundi]